MVGNMKEFLKWLGVNEKIAKVAVWILIFMVSLIIINACLESVGLPYYKLTIENLSKVNTTKAIEYSSAWLVTILNFYTSVLLVFRANEFEKLIKYAVIYLVLNILVNELFGYGYLQIFIIIYILAFCFFHSKKNWKYIIYGLISIIINSVVQYVLGYLYKMKYMDYNVLTQTTRMLLSLDYFIVMGIIILVKEIYLKRRDKSCQEAGYGLEASTQRVNFF